jgi:hypothetical protein
MHRRYRRLSSGGPARQSEKTIERRQTREPLNLHKEPQIGGPNQMTLRAQTSRKKFRSRERHGPSADTAGHKQELSMPHGEHHL